MNMVCAYVNFHFHSFTVIVLLFTTITCLNDTFGCFSSPFSCFFFSFFPCAVSVSSFAKKKKKKSFYSREKQRSKGVRRRRKTTGRTFSEAKFTLCVCVKQVNEKSVWNFFVCSFGEMFFMKCVFNRVLRIWELQRVKTTVN